MPLKLQGAGGAVSEVTEKKLNRAESAVTGKKVRARVEMTSCQRYTNGAKEAQVTLCDIRTYKNSKKILDKNPF
jgi:hypothetical protein